MRVGMVSKFHAADGLCVRASYVAQGLTDRGHEVYAFTQSPDVQVIPPERVHRFRAVQLNPHFSFDAPSVPRLIAERSQELGIEIIHVQMNSGSTEAILPFFKNHLPPLVVTFHLAYAAGPALYRTVFRIAWDLSIYAAKHYDQIVLVDPSQKRYFIRYGVPPERLTVIRNGVDTQLFRPPKKRPDDGIVDFVFVGRLSLDKGVDVLLDAFRKYHDENPDTRLTLVGDGILKWMIENGNDNNGSIHWLGTIPHDQVPATLQRSDVFVIPQNIGGLGLSVLEAMSCGLPVITTAIGETTRLLGDNEGVLVQPNDVDAVVDAMRFLAENDSTRLRMGERCRQKVERHYSWNVQLELLEGVYARACS
ncbi:MAG: glycosyltransferase family 4 protein [Candidatus Thorarchaeota archaeon]